jgi:hypothetical protein
VGGGTAFDNTTISTQAIEDDSDDIDNEESQDTRTVTVPLTVCISIMIGWVARLLN